jgi:DNA-binding response OmpR family regulator
VAPIDRKPIALIVDDDLGLIFWLGEILGKAGWNVVPALNCRQAVSLATMWDSYVDLVVVNPALSGVSEMVETLSRVQRPMVVVIRDPNAEPGIIKADATIERPDMRTSLSSAEWAERVRKAVKYLVP